MSARAHTPRRKPAKPATAARRPAPRSLWRGFVLTALAGLVIGAGSFGFAFYWPSIRPKAEGPSVLHIPTGTDYRGLEAILDTAGVVHHWATFRFTAEQMGLTQRVKPGRYVISRPMGNRAFVNVLRLGLQTPLRLSIPSRRSVAAILQRIGEQIECPGDSLVRAFAEPALRDSLGFDERTLLGLFIPNTYEVYWNVSPRALAQRLRSEYDRYWDSTRVAQAAAQQLTPLQATTLASIVEWETYRDDERPRIAGVYLNRLRRGMLLQADPTVIFAHQDWSIRRVLNKHLTIDSPYNTYKYAGLPPGPINAPSVASIEAVLTPEKHDYLYFAARAELDGYHTFSATYQQHLNAAADYHRTMNQQARRKKSG